MSRQLVKLFNHLYAFEVQVHSFTKTLCNVRLKPSVEDLSAYYVLDLTSTRFILSDLGEQGVLIAQDKPFRKTFKVR